MVINVTLTAGQSLTDAIPPKYLPIVNMAIEPKALGASSLMAPGDIGSEIA